MKYGDYDNVKKDSKVIFEIIQRQGSGLLIEVIAEHIGRTVLKSKLPERDVMRLIDSILIELKEAIIERT